MYLQINGGKKLNGELNIRAAKNSILPIIAATVLTKEMVVLKNCPPLLDIYAMLDIIKSIGGRADFVGDTITINCKDVVPNQIDSLLTQGIRSSIFILGPILSRFKNATISLPGGCEIGKRPIDLHIDGLAALGVKIDIRDDMLYCDGSRITGGKINLRLPSVGATENIIMAAVLASGTTTIVNAAKEPEIIDLADFINMLGGRVFGAGTATIIIEGVKKLAGGEYTPIPDRIVAGTYLAATAACGGKIKLNNVNVKHIYSIIDRLQKAGCRFSYKQNSPIATFSEFTANKNQHKSSGFNANKNSSLLNEFNCDQNTVFSGGGRLNDNQNSVIITASGGGAGGHLRAIKKTSTMPYPGFPTDMQAQLTAMLSLANGTSTLTENLFENRFRYITQLKKMGADIGVDGFTATINGVPALKGARLEAQDLRGGAALIIAALAAEGESTVHGIHHIDRGYYKIEDDLKALGGDIIRKT